MELKVRNGYGWKIEMMIVGRYCSHIRCMRMMSMLLITLGVTFSNETHVAQMYVTPATDGLEVMLFLHLFAVLFEQRKHLERDSF